MSRNLCKISTKKEIQQIISIGVSVKSFSLFEFWRRTFWRQTTNSGITSKNVRRHSLKFNRRTVCFCYFEIEQVTSTNQQRFSLPSSLSCIQHTHTHTHLFSVYYLIKWPILLEVKLLKNVLNRRTQDDFNVNGS